MIFRGWGGIFIPLTGGFLIINAKAEQMAVAAEARLDGITVDDVTWYGVAGRRPTPTPRPCSASGAGWVCLASSPCRTARAS